MTRLELLNSVASMVIASNANFARLPRYRDLWLVRDDEEVHVPFTRDASVVYLAGFRSIAWILRDKKAPVAQGYASISIDLIETLFEMQALLGGIALQVSRGYCVSSPHGESDAHAGQHAAGLAVDLLLSPAQITALRARGYIRAEDVYASHVHVSALADRWQRSRGTA